MCLCAELAVKRVLLKLANSLLCSLELLFKDIVPVTYIVQDYP